MDRTRSLPRPLPTPQRPARQRGAATLLATLSLCTVLLLATLFAQRGLLLEARMSANQARSTIAFEAAEAGLEWAIAQLDHPQRIGDDCRSASAATSSFRERHVSMSSAPEGFTGRTWDRGGTNVPLRPACVRDTTGWNCRCPGQGPAHTPEPAGAVPAPAFSLRFEPGGRAGVLRIVSVGCTRAAGPCAPGTATTVEAMAQVEVSVALVPALAAAPAAPLTARGAVDTPAAVGFVNTDPRSGGIAVHAGAAVDVPLARIVTPAGSSSAGSLAGQDAHLAAMSPDSFFVSFFGLSKAAWQRQGVVQRLACRRDCQAMLSQAIDNSAGPAQLWIDGDVDLDGPLALGSAAQPVLVVATGQLRLRGAVQVHGVLYANGIAWEQAMAPNAFARGALISEAGYAGDASPDLVYDPDVLSTLRSLAGSLARVPGSWRDF